jgi:hypothetical protein
VRGTKIWKPFAIRERQYRVMKALSLRLLEANPDREVGG